MSMHRAAEIFSGGNPVTSIAANDGDHHGGGDMSEGRVSRTATRRAGIPDMRAIRLLPIADVARMLDLRISGSMIHCWHADRHQHGDRTASVGVQKSLNRVKCFGCDSRPMGPHDFVADVLGVGLKESALWIAARFKVPYIAPGRHVVEPPRIIHKAGFETPLGLLIRSGLWARLSPLTQRLLTVLCEFAEFKPADTEKRLCLSYRAMMRYTAIGSPNGLGKALAQLEEIR